MRLFLLLSILVLCPLKVNAGENHFFYMTDIPVMNGFKEIKEYGYVFDKPEGRIIEAVAVAGNDIVIDDVKDFYKETLGQLGWVYVEDGIYKRENEKLSLNIYKDNNLVTLKLNIEP